MTHTDNSPHSFRYACSMKNLVTTWREQWSVNAGTTSPTFPFGIVSLAAGTSEGHTQAMPVFRHAQTASYGMLPGPKGSGMEKTFIAQAYDAADPGVRHLGAQGGQPGRGWSELDSPYQADYDAPFNGRQGYSGAGLQRYTQQYMGGLHPRAKQTIGRRLALAAANVAYGQTDVSFTGPVLKNCSILKANAKCFPGGDITSAACQQPDYHGGINQRQITLNFDEALLGEDAVRVWQTAPDTEGIAMTTLYNCLNGTCLTECADGNQTCANFCQLNTPGCKGWAASPLGPAGNGGNPTQYNSQHRRWTTGTSISPFEVEFNNSLWMPAPISFNAGSSGGDMVHRNCKQDPNHPDVKPCTCTPVILGSLLYAV